MRISDSKQLEQFIRTAKARAEQDAFGKDILGPQIEQFEQMQHFEKSIDKILSQKRIEIQESLAFSQQNVDTTLRVFMDSKITQATNGDRIFALNIFGRLLLKDEEGQSGEQGEFFQGYKSNHLFEKNLFKRFYFPDFVKELTVEFSDNSLAPIKYAITSEKLKKSNMKNHEKAGFIIVRTMPQEITSEGLGCRISFLLEGQTHELKPCLAEFMKRSHATRREILDQIWDYISAHHLLEKSQVTLDAYLRKSLDMRGSEHSQVSLSEISLLIKPLMGEAPRFTFDYVIKEASEKNGNLKAYDTAITLPIDEVSDCMAFFVQKLIFTDEEKDKFLREEGVSDFNGIIRANEKANQLQESIIRRFQMLEKRLTKRDSFAKVKNNVPQFLGGLVDSQKQVVSSIKGYSSNILGKRTWNDENDFTSMLAEHYEPLLEREIGQYLKSKGLLKE
jgi:hypothetical protein